MGSAQFRLKLARLNWLLALRQWDDTRVYSARESYLAAVRNAERELASLARAREFGFWLWTGAAEEERL
jgi:hypothetical protein